VSDATGPRLNRRTLLAAISTVGTAGALTGRGAAALLSDRETLGTNRATAGRVTLALDGDEATERLSVDFRVDDYGYASRDVAEVCLGLDVGSNPGWVWLRSCPRHPDVEAHLAAAVTYGGTTVFQGTLGGLLDRLAGVDGGGVLLTTLVGEGETPVTPGPDGRVCLEIAVWAPSTLADDPDAVRALKRASPLGFAIDVYAEQSRHVPTPRRPVAGSNPSFVFPDCDSTGDSQDDPGYAISNVSLCTAGPVDPSAVSWVVRDPATGADVTDDPGEAFDVVVTAPVPIDSAVVKAGREFRRFDAGGATTVAVTSTGGTLLDVPQHFARCACDGDGVKLDDWSDARGTFATVVPLSCDDSAAALGTGEESTGPDEASESTDPADGPGRGRNARNGSPGAPR
jgi:hypothetical protein